MAVVLPQGKQQFFDANGDPAVGWKLYTYIPLTSTPKDTYTDYTGGTENTNPVVMDARGEASIYWTGDYDVILKTDADVTVWGPERLEDTGGNLRLDLADSSDAAKGDALVAVKQPYAGAVARTQHDKNSDFVSVKDFGAVGDGATDDTDAIQAAIDSERAVEFPDDGVYIVSYLLISSSNVTLYSRAGATLKRKNGIAAQANSFMIESLEDCDNIVIDGLKFDHNVGSTAAGTVNNACVWLYRTHYSAIRNCRVLSCHGGGSNANSALCVIDSSYFYEITGNEVNTGAGTGLCGAIFFQGGEAIVTNNVTEQVRDVAIVMNGAGSAGAVISNNAVNNTVGGGIAAENGASDIVIVGNKINTVTQGYGIGVIYIGTPGALSKGIVIVSNLIDGSSGSDLAIGIAVQTHDEDCVVSGNTIIGLASTNASSAAITIDGRALVTGNMISDNASPIGINTTGLNVRLRGNTIIGTGGAAVSGIQGSGDQTGSEYTGNYISGWVEGISLAGGSTVTDLCVRDNTFGTISSKRYALGGTATMFFQPEIQLADFYVSAAPAAAGLPIAGNATDGFVSVDFATAFDSVSTFWAYTDKKELRLVHSGFANGGLTVTFSVFNLSGSSSTPTVVHMIGRVAYSNYQE